MSVENHLMPFAVEHQWIASPAPAPNKMPTIILHQMVQNNIRSWHCCFNENAIKRIEEMIEDLKTDEKYATSNRTGNRLRRSPNLQKDHVAIAFEEYSEIIQHCLRSRFTLYFSQNGSAKLATVSRTSDKDWGFSLSALQDAAREIKWPDR